jgi:rhodanese-related sulfurtransferase
MRGSVLTGRPASLSDDDEDTRGTAVTNEISRDELSRLVQSSSPPVLLEALGAAYFADAHLPGAVNMPPDQVDVLAPSLIPDQDAPVVVYCSGTCQNSEIAAQRLEELGYSDVRVYLGGKEDWVEHGLPVLRSDDT